MVDRIRARPDHLAVWLDQGPWTLDPLRDAARDYAARRPALTTTPPVVGEAIPLHTTDVTSDLLEVDDEHRRLAREVEAFVDALGALDRRAGPGAVVDLPAAGVPPIDPVDEADVDGLLDAMADSSWFTVPWTTYGLADSLSGAVQASVYAPRIAELMRRYAEEVVLWEQAPTEGRALRAWLEWQQDASTRVELDELLRRGGRVDPAVAEFRAATRASGAVDEAGLFVRFSRFSAVAGRVVVPLGLVLDGAAVLDDDTSTGDRIAAGAGLASGGVAALTMVGVAFPPSVVVAAGVLGVASAAWGLWQLRGPIADGAVWVWDHTGGALWRGGTSMVDGIADGLTGLATLGWR